METGENPFSLHSMATHEISSFKITGYSFLIRAAKMFSLLSAPMFVLSSLGVGLALNIYMLFILAGCCIAITCAFNAKYQIEVFTTTEGDELAKVAKKRAWSMLFYSEKSMMFNVNTVKIVLEQENDILSVMLIDGAQQFILTSADESRLQNMQDGVVTLATMLGLKRD